MVKERLVKYVLKFAEKGYLLKDIRARLLKDGWSDSEIQEAVKVVREELRPAETPESEKPKRFREGLDKKKSSRRKTSRVKDSTKKSSKKSSGKSGVKGMATWKKRLIIILSVVVLLAVGILAAFLIFS